LGSSNASFFIGYFQGIERDTTSDLAGQNDYVDRVCIEITAVKKLLRFFERYFFYSGTAVILLAFVSQVWQQIRWHEFEPNRLWPYLVLLPLLCFCTWYVCHFQKASLTGKQLWAYLSLDFPVLRMLRTVSLTVVIAVLMGASIYSSSLLWLYGGKVLSYSFDSVNQFEIAERVFSLTNATEDFSFSSISERGWSAKSQFPEPDRILRLKERENSQLDAAVSNVYGASSIQMARRYLSNGLNVENNGGDRRVCARLYKKSLELSMLNHDYRKSLVALVFLTEIQFVLGQKEELRQSLSTALTVASRCKNTRTNFENLKCIFNKHSL